MVISVVSSIFHDVWRLKSGARGPLPGEFCGNDEGDCPQIPEKGYRAKDLVRVGERLAHDFRNFDGGESVPGVQVVLTAFVDYSDVSILLRVRIRHGAVNLV